MKLLRVGAEGSEKPAVLASDGTIRDLSNVVDDIDGRLFDNSELARVSALDWNSLPIVNPGVRIGPCITVSKNYVCIGANYADAVEEQGKKPPDEPVVFLKSLSAICGANDDLILPAGSVKSDWEVELGVVIGQTARSVSEQAAMSHVAGYCISNDLSEREYQYEHGPTWDKGKGFDTFGPIGPWFVTKDEVTDPHNLDLWLDVDGVRMQTGNTKTMIFNIPQIIAYVSRLITLHPGDIISTGTPPGGGIAQMPDPIFLKIGQTVHCGIQGLGEQRQVTVAR